MDSRGKVAEHLAKCYMHLDECRRALAELESALLTATAKAAVKKRPSPLQRLGAMRRASREPMVSLYDAPPEEVDEEEEEGVYETHTKLENLSFTEKRQVIGNILSSKKKK